MDSKATVCLAVAVALAAWAFASPGAEFADLGGGLVKRGDGSVIAAWELPGCDVSSDAFDAPATTAAWSGPSDAVWRVRFDRGW